MSFSKELFEAIGEDFTEEELAVLLTFSMDLEWDHIKTGGTYQFRVFNFLKYVERRNRVAEFVDHALAARPTNAVLNAVATKHVSTPTGPSDEPSEESLEKQIRKRAPALDWGLFMGRSQELAYRICSISFPVGSGTLFGTGWLIGADLLLTNRHVVSRVIDLEVSPDAVECLFDLRTDSGGDIVNAGVVAGLANEGWLVASSPHAQEDVKVGMGDPPLNKLDFAVLRLDKKMGDLPIGDKAVPGAKKRGWFRLPTDPVNLQVTDDILVFQHPNGNPLKIAFGRINEIVENRSRARYDATTDGGSSGSPVFTPDFNLIALHHAGDPNVAELAKYNQGIPLHLITAELKTKKILDGSV